MPIYQRGGTLVRPIIETVDASRGRKTKVAQLRVLDTVYLRDLLGRYAVWVRYDERKKRMLRDNPPMEIAATVLARVGEWTFPAICRCHLGADDASRWFAADGARLRPGDRAVAGRAAADAGDTGSADQGGCAGRAGANRRNCWSDFPSSTTSPRRSRCRRSSHPIVRGAFPVTPMHASRAPTAGSGKSFLWDTVAAIAIGQLMPVMSTGASEEETEKRLGAALMTGQPLISIDNISGELGGDALCQIIERPVVDIRILGRSERSGSRRAGLRHSRPAITSSSSATCAGA